MLFILACEREQLNLDDPSLSPEASERLQRGDLAGALNQHLSGPTPPCPTLATQEPTGQAYRPLPRPTASQSKEVRLNNCRQRARQAKRLGMTNLTIGFEGLGSFSQSYANRFYDTYDKLKAGEQVSQLPTSGFGSHLGRLLLAPHLRESHRNNDFILLPERGGAEAIKECVAIYRSEIGASFSLSILGISYGAGEAMVLAESLSSARDFPPNGIPVSNLVTFDLRGSPRVGGYGPRTRMSGPFRTPPNVRRHQNYGRFSASELLPVSPSLGFPGYRSQASPSPSSQTFNISIPATAGHTNQLKRREIQEFYQSIL